MNGLAPHTGKIIEAVSKLECIKPYTLVGGTALSIQIGARQSEDLDFQRWRTSKTEKMEVAWYKIEKELSTIGEVSKIDILDADHVEFVVNDVKLSFYACDKYSPINDPVPYMNNIVLADVVAIGAMKLEVMLRRNHFRDYYDVYSILQRGISLDTLIAKALEYSKHRLKSKNLLAMLTRGSLFCADSSFEHLCPIYAITPNDIEKYLKQCLQNSQYMKN